MNSKLICDALNLIDDTYIEENILFKNISAAAPSERNMSMNANNIRKPRKSLKKMIALGIAACIVLSLVITASASNLWNIRDIFRKTGREISEQAYDYVVPQSVSATGKNWECVITESLCDSSEITVTVEFTCSQEYLLVPSYDSSNSSTSCIGIESDMTIAEYAASQDKKLMFIDSRFLNCEAFDVIASYAHFERIADNKAIMLTHANIEKHSLFEKGICTVYVDGSKHELNFDISEAPASFESVYVPANPDAVYGITAGNMIAAETPLGISIEIMFFVNDFDAFDRMEMKCGGINGLLGGFSQGVDGNWYLTQNNGCGELTDTVTVHVLDSETHESIGDIIFKKK